MMNTRCGLLGVGLACLLCWSPLALAEQNRCAQVIPEKEYESLLKSVENRYGEISDVAANFVQRSFFLGLSRTVKSRGTVYFKRPGMMDWSYEEPEKQRFVGDGTFLWFFQPALNQVTVTDFKSSFSSDLPVSFLIGVGSIREQFSLRSACRNGEEIELKLESKKPDPNLDDFTLWLRSSDYTPIGANVVDVSGNETQINMHEIIINSNLPEERFKFEIPAGVDIIDQRAQKNPS